MSRRCSGKARKERLSGCIMMLGPRSKQHRRSPSIKHKRTRTLCFCCQHSEAAPPDHLLASGTEEESNVDC